MATATRRNASSRASSAFSGTAEAPRRGERVPVPDGVDLDSARAHRRGCGERTRRGARPPRSQSQLDHLRGSVVRPALLPEGPVELKPNTVSRPAQAERRSVLTTIIFALFFAAL